MPPVFVREMQSEPPLMLGEKVVIMGKRKGTVRYIGDTAYGPGEWVGVELEKPTGTHDGGVNGQVETNTDFIWLSVGFSNIF